MRRDIASTMLSPYPNSMVYVGPCATSMVNTCAHSEARTNGPREVSGKKSPLGVT